MRSLDARITKLEQPNGDLLSLRGRHLAILVELHRILHHLDGSPLPSDDELSQRADALAHTGKAPAQLWEAAMQVAWAEEDYR